MIIGREVYQLNVSLCDDVKRGRKRGVPSVLLLRIYNCMHRSNLYIEAISITYA